MPFQGHFKVKIIKIKHELIGLTASTMNFSILDIYTFKMHANINIHISRLVRRHTHVL